MPTYHVLLSYDIMYNDWGLLSRFDTITEAHLYLQNMPPEEHNFYRVEIDMPEPEYLKALLVACRRYIWDLFNSRRWACEIDISQYDPHKVAEVDNLLAEICTLKNQPIGTFEDILKRLAENRSKNENDYLLFKITREG